MHLHHIQYNGYVVIVDSLEEPLAIIHDGEGKLEFCRNFSDNVKKKITNYASSKKLIWNFLFKRVFYYNTLFSIDLAWQ